MKSFLESIIKNAGEIALEYRSRLSEVRVDRKGEKDLVTEADIAVEHYLVKQIRQTYPDHAILGEETGTHDGSDYRWIIDPIDGTTSFVHGQPFFSISIAVEHAGELTLSGVYAPVLDELFIAEKGKGATRNGESIAVSDRDTLSDCAICTGFSAASPEIRRANIVHFANIVPNIRAVRRFGSAALELCFVGCGRLDGYWEMGLNDYDISGGRLVCIEAGGTVTDFSGTTANNIPAEVLATNGKIHNQLSQLLTAT